MKLGEWDMDIGGGGVEGRVCLITNALYECMNSQRINKNNNKFLIPVIREAELNPEVHNHPCSAAYESNCLCGFYYKIDGFITFHCLVPIKCSA